MELLRPDDHGGAAPEGGRKGGGLRLDGSLQGSVWEIT